MSARTQNFWNVIGGLLVAVCLLFVPATDGLSQTDAKLVKQERIKSWRYLCLEVAPEPGADAVRQCRINSQLWTKEEKPRLFMAVVISIPEPGARPVLVLRLPGGILADQKVRMQVDAKATLLSPPVICGEAACRTVMTMSTTQVDQMKSGNILALGFKGPQGKEIKSQISLLGFTSAFDTLAAGGN